MTLSCLVGSATVLPLRGVVSSSASLSNGPIQSTCDSTTTCQASTILSNEVDTLITSRGSPTSNSGTSIVLSAGSFTTILVHSSTAPAATSSKFSTEAASGPQSAATVTGTLAWKPSSSAFQSGQSHTSASMPSYTFYQGDGSIAAGWPPPERWISFEDMWARQVQQIRTQCTSPDSEEEISSLRSAISDTGERAAVDPRLILGVVMQESIGCVRVPTTGFCGSPDCANPGVMQSHMGTGTCNIDGVLTEPCPDATIRQMIFDGTMGTADYNLARLINENAQFPLAQAYWRAARQYNHGRGPTDGSAMINLSDHSYYVSNLANRMCGWVGFWPPP